MDDAIDDAMADDEELGEDEQVDEILTKVLDEIGVDLNTSLKDTPNTINVENAQKADARVAEAIGGHNGGLEEDDLQARLDSLKK